MPTTRRNFVHLSIALKKVSNCLVLLTLNTRVTYPSFVAEQRSNPGGKKQWTKKIVPAMKLRGYLVNLDAEAASTRCNNLLRSYE